MFRELFRAKCAGKDYKSVMAAMKAATGEDDFLGFLKSDDPEKELKTAVQAGFIEFDDDNDIVIVNADICD